MTRLAGITAIYAVVATLVLAAPLSASPEGEPEAPAPATEAAPAPGDDPAPGGETAPGAGEEGEPAPGGETAPGAGAPAPGDETASAPGDETAPEGTAPAPEAAPVPAPTPAEPAPAGAEPADDAAPERRARDERPDAKAAASTTVTIRDFEFAPASVTIDVGDTVTWSNEGPTGHTATADDGSFDTGLLSDGQSGSHTFGQAGTFSYFCEPHPYMKGTVTVQAAAGGGGGGDAGGSGGDAGAGTTGAESAAGTGDESGAALPATGLEPGGLAVLGLATLALGAWLRRRANAAAE
jgi:plastocyanin